MLPITYEKIWTPACFDLEMPALDPIIAAADKRLAGDDPELTAALKADIFAHPGKRNMWSAYEAIEKKNAVMHSRSWA